MINGAVLDAPIVRRVYGTEIEYGLSGVDPSTETLHNIFGTILPDCGQASTFLGNGGRLYRDLGDHPEYATPECMTIEEAVEHELAGERIVTMIADFLISKNGSEIRLNKRNISGQRNEDYQLIAWGTHENYLTQRGRAPSERLIPALAAHLATRSIFTGSGGMLEQRFVVAQKMQVINCLSNSTAHQTDRPLVDTKDDPLAHPYYRRVQVSCGDANISPWALAMKLGTTSLVLRLVEHGVDIADLALRNPVKTANQCAKDISARLPIAELDSGKKMSAVELQQELAERVVDLSKIVEIPQEELEVLCEWLAIINTISQDVLDAGDKIDWVARYRLLKAVDSRLSFKDMKSRHDRMAATDLQYDALTGRGQFGRCLRERGAFAWSPSSEAIRRAMHEPPSTPRARFRSSLIRKARRNHLIVEVESDWQTMTIGKTSHVIESPFTEG